MTDLSGKIALVTGAGRGIGRSIALRFARAGARVAAMARTASDLESAAAQADGPGMVLPIIGDVSSVDDVGRATGTVHDELGPVDILVNNAAVFLHRPIVETSPDEWTRVMAVNVAGPFFVTRAVLPEMIERKAGKIINVCSTAAHRAYASQSAYVASKHALLGFTKVLAEETRGTGVTVHAISPGGVNTSFVRARHDVDFSEYMGPDEVAEVALFLAGMDRIAVMDEVIVRRKGAEPFR